MEKSSENSESKTEIKALKDIKSSYIIEQIFSFLDEDRQLEMIKHNKNYQNLLSLNIESYKKKSGRYKKDGINGYGQEFSLDCDNLVFEGEYLNGKRNGTGKEYTKWGNELMFEGEYLNGKRNGKGKEYYYNGMLEYEGEYLNGKRNSKGKGYNNKYDSEYEGEY